MHMDVAEITFLGNKEIILKKISTLGLDIKHPNIIEPLKSKYFNDYAETYYKLRKHKGITKDNAFDVMSSVNHFGTMMVYKGHADGMVSGSVHSTRNTVRPAFEIVKTKPGSSRMSSVFFMCLEDRVLVYGDCAVNPNPTSEQLAEIAVKSAETADIFGVKPVVAMLSYSTGTSGVGEEVDKVRKATRLSKTVKVYSFNSKSDTWWDQGQTKFTRLTASFYQFQWESIQALATLVKRTMDLSVTITEDTAYISAEHGACEVTWVSLL